MITLPEDDMGWAFCETAEGRQVGYGIGGVCEDSACTAVIDLGLSYVCGGMHDGGEFGCGRYFCLDHLFHTGPGTVHQLCEDCADSHTCSECEVDDDMGPDGLQAPESEL